jgi:hypothetical protein
MDPTEDEELYFETDLDFDFDFPSDNILDILQGNTPTILELSNGLRTSFKKISQKTSGFTDRMNSKRLLFLKDKEREIKKKLKEKRIISLRDKIVFVLGVSYIWLTSLVLGGFPNLMPLYFLVTTFPLITVRWFYYKTKKWHYFLAYL